MIFVIGAVCERCGTPLRIEEPNATGDAYIRRHDGDRIMTLCKNVALCEENRAARDGP